MRILFYLPTPGGMTGAPRRLLTLAAGLKALGASPIIVSEPGVPLLHAAEKAGLKTLPLPLGGLLNLRQGALFGGGLRFRLRVAAALLRQQLHFHGAVRAANADVVWLRGSKGVAFGGLGLLLTRRPLIWDVDYELPSRGPVRLLHRLGLILARRVVLQHDASTAVFGSTLAARHCAKLKVLTPGIDVDSLKQLRESSPPRAADGRLHLLQVGTLCDRKNQSFTLDVLRRLPQETLERVELSFAGAPHGQEYEPALRRKLDELGLGDRVRFLGWRDDVHALMLRSDLLIMPSRDEGVPNTVQEAMALGLPVLASDRGGIPDVLEHGSTGWVLPLDDPGPWASILDRFVKETRILDSVAARAQAHAWSHFDTAAWCRRYLGLIEEACGR